MPGDGQVPYMSVLADRLYRRLPEIFRVLDARDSTWPFKRYLGAVLAQAGAIENMINLIAGDNPVGPGSPEPWGMVSDELTRWQLARLNRKSALGDPDQADLAWLPWLAQLIGAKLNPYASENEQRDTIRYATSGYRAGTRTAIADAAKSALTGTKYAQILPHQKPSGGVLIAGTAWDITIVTRTSETPNPSAVLGAVSRKGVKPAGAVLWHQAYEASWTAVGAEFPTWADWNAATWQDLGEAGL
jgi:hypothetical protein